MSFLSLALAVLAGGLGVLLRYGLTLWIPNKKKGFPLAIFAANILGSFLAGIILGLLSQMVVTEDIAYVLLAGFCGGLTTMSTFAVDSLEAITSGKWVVAGMNILGTTVGGLAAVTLGIVVINFALV